MNKDEILQAFHLIAMGRARHPLHEQLAEKLAEVFAMPRAEAVPMDDCGVLTIPQPVKRGPGRPKKAE